MPQFDPGDRENSPAISPIAQTAQQPPRRFEPSPEKSPLRDITTMGARSLKGKGKPVERPRHSDFRQRVEQSRDDPELDEYEQAVQSIEADVVDPQGWNEIETNGHDDDEMDLGGQATLAEDEQELPSVIEEVESLSIAKPQPTQANSRRKRKSDVIEEEENAASSPTPEGKKRKTKPAIHRATKPKHVPAPAVQRLPSEAPQPVRAPKGRPPTTKPTAELSTRQESELNQIVERVRARPGQQRSLYILRRETPADDTVTHTRSGRVSVKPLAYWRNERCVYGGSPGGAQLADGARFPLNSIKEIVRTDEVDPGIKKRSASGKKGKGKGRKRAETDDSDEDSEEQDPDAEPWESSHGIFRGPVSIWDPQQQAPLEIEEEVDLAYAPAAIETREVKGSNFKYAKLLSTPFFGTGIVDLPPGAEKRPKNSRRMVMSFFVARGRVTVSVGAYGGAGSVFSVGKGGFWTVPRGQ
jgi:centromere protein C